MKKIIVVILLITTTLFSKAQKQEFKLTEQQSIEVLNSVEFNNSINLQNNFIDIIVTKIKDGVSLQTIENLTIAAMNSGNYDILYQTLFGDYNTGEAFFTSIDNAKKELKKKFPFITEHPEILICTTCSNTLTDNVKGFYKNFEVYNSNRFTISNNTNNLLEEVPTCGSYWNQVKLGLCITAVGVSSGGIGAAAGMWGCWCTFCTQNSTVANTICAN
ncbi:MAG: hypothetical protein KA319_06020 [Ferruginibacter sp.]|nr:hypothetical protein [Ferruginibacter sp.]